MGYVVIRASEGVIIMRSHRCVVGGVEEEWYVAPISLLLHVIIPGFLIYILPITCSGLRFCRGVVE
jgi:hypothetical protein